MFLKNRFSIKNEVLFLGFLSSLLILAVFGFFIFTSLYYTSIENSKRTVREKNLKVSVFTEGFIREISNTVETLAENKDIRNVMRGDEGTRERALSIYENVLLANPYILYVYSGYEDGSLLINDYIPPAGFDSTKRPWYIAAMESKPALATGIPYLEANSGEWMIASSKVLIDSQNNIAGVIAIDIALETIVQLLGERHTFVSQRSYVIDRAGRIIIHPDDSLIGLTIPEIGNAITGSQGELSYSIDSTEVLAYYNTIDETDLLIVTTVDRQEILKPIVSRIAISMLGVILLAGILGAVQSKIFGKRFAEPLTELGNRIAAITAGKSIGKPGYKYSNYEISTIANNIEELAEHSLKKKANELKTIIESTETGILVVNDQQEIIYTNSRFREIWKLPPGLIATDEKQAFIDAVLEQLIDPEPFLKKFLELHISDQNDMDILVFRDGRIFELLSRPLMDRGQVVGRLWRLRDVTQRKQTEQQLHDYMTELELRGVELEQLYLHLDEQINKARHIHERTLPAVLPQVEGLLLAAHYQPAQKLGGDFYNIIKTGNRLVLYLSDVSGHGLDGAMLSAFIKEAIDSYISLKPEAIMPDKILRHLNRQYRNENYPDDYFICIFLAVLNLETMVLSYTGAGFQEFPRVHNAAGERSSLKVEGPPIAAAIPDDIMNFTTGEIALKPGTTVLFTTDGLPEQGMAEEEYGARLDNAFHKHSDLPPEDIVRKINEDFLRFNSGSLQADDDITFLVLQVAPVE